MQTSSIHSAGPIPTASYHAGVLVRGSALTEPSPARRIGRLMEFLVHEERKKARHGKGCGGLVCTLGTRIVVRGCV